MDHSQIAAAVKAAAETLDQITARDYPTLHARCAVSLRMDVGKVYTRLVKVEIDRTTGEEQNASAWGWIKNDGASLWKSAGWKAPAKNKARGELADLYNVAKVTGWRYGIQ